MTSAAEKEESKNCHIVHDEMDTRFARFMVYMILIAIAYITVSYAYYLMLAGPLAKAQMMIHKSVIEGTAPKPIQYRVLTYYMVEALHRLTGIAVWRSDLILRFAFTSLSLIYFQRFLRGWFDFTSSAVGALIMGALLPITYVDHTHQPHDIPNLFFTILALGFIRNHREAWLLILIPIAMLNRESFIFVFWAWLFYNIARIPFRTIVVEFLLFTLIALVVYLALPYYFGPRASYVEMVQLKNNLNPPMMWKWFSRLAAFIGPMVLALCMKFKSQPVFLKRSLGYVAVYMIVMFFIGKYQETRLFLPILPVLIPLGLASIFPVYDPDSTISLPARSENEQNG